MIAVPALLPNIIGGSVLFAMMAYAQVRHEIEAGPTTPRPAGEKVRPYQGIIAMTKTHTIPATGSATLKPRFRRSYRRPATLPLLVTALALAACSNNASLPIDAGYGPNPTLPAPQQALIPTVYIADAHGWPAGQTPQVSSGLQIKAFASDLDHPRWLYTLPNGDILVAETDAPPKPEDSKGLRGWVRGLVMQKAGSDHPSANRITLLRDTDADGVADVRKVFIDQLNSPFGMVLVGQHLYVAATDAVLVFPYSAGATRIDAPPQQLVALPGGPINHHWTKNIIANADGSKLYVTVGSNSNIGENGMAAEQGRAAIWEVNSDGSGHREFATGLRNPNGMAWKADSKVLWTVVNERDELGGDLVPDYLTSVRDGGFYGWPYSYCGQHVDDRVQPQQPALVASALVPDYALGSHTASLGLVSSDGQSLAPRYAHGMFIGQHGSWNRRPRSGYKVVFVPFDGTNPSGQPVDVVTGFLHEDQAYGRPVGVALDKGGALLVADDVGNTVWRVSAAARILSQPCGR
ncbi:MAG: glucose/arabinose dehydrogenase [Halieaceae bacterium]|jgi:glucose/arabinose dehydrogenase